jgi:NADPH:quinone reductase-like Zn-dependent oxidoreductase
MGLLDCVDTLVMKTPRTVEVVAASTAPISSRLFAGWGQIEPGRASVPGEAVLCACSGRDAATNQDVIALLDEPAQIGASVAVDARFCFERRPSKLRTSLFNPWTHAAAAQLPLLALTAAAALHSVGLPTSCRSIGTESKVPATVLVAGSSGRLPSLLVELIAARGARPCVAAHKQACERLRGLGASEVIDHDDLSFSSSFGVRQSDQQPLDAVLDCVGAESSPDPIRRALGAAYISLASPPLRRLEENGAVEAVKERWRQWQSGRQQEEEGGGGGRGVAGATIWRADELAAEALREVLQYIEDGKVAPPPAANLALETIEIYNEYINWARDSESGLRYGFPGDSIWPEEGGEEEESAGFDVRRSRVQRLRSAFGSPSNLELIYMPEEDEGEDRGCEDDIEE